MERNENSTPSTENKNDSQMQILLFSLGTKETLGVNVLRVREVCQTPELDKMPRAKPGFIGMFNLRGVIMPALDLSHFCQIGCNETNSRKTMMIIDSDNLELGFVIDSVDKIITVDWSEVKAPEHFTSNDSKSLLMALVKKDERLISVLDIERILNEAFGDRVSQMNHEVISQKLSDGFALIVDDSSLSRKKISEIFDKLGAEYVMAENGMTAWERLEAIAKSPETLSRLRLVLTDAEMPEKDGLDLLRMIKADPRFNHVKVIVHSSISTDLTQKRVDACGADGLVAKFNPKVLSENIISNWGAR